MSVELPIHKRFSEAQLELLPKDIIVCQMQAKTLKEIVKEIKAAGIAVHFDLLEGRIYESDDIWRILSVEGEVAFDPVNPYIEGSNRLGFEAQRNYELQVELQKQFSKSVEDRIPGVNTMIGNLSTHLALALEYFRLSNGQWLYLPSTKVRTTTPVPCGYYYQSNDRYPFVVGSYSMNRLYAEDARDGDGYINLDRRVYVLALYKPEAVLDWNYVHPR